MISDNEKHGLVCVLKYLRDIFDSRYGTVYRYSGMAVLIQGIIDGMSLIEIQSLTNQIAPELKGVVSGLVTFSYGCEINDEIIDS